MSYFPPMRKRPENRSMQQRNEMLAQYMLGTWLLEQRFIVPEKRDEFRTRITNLRAGCSFEPEPDDAQHPAPSSDNDNPTLEDIL